jgi:hypothetical protein
MYGIARNYAADATKLHAFLVSVRQWRHFMNVNEVGSGMMPRLNE